MKLRNNKKIIALSLSLITVAVFLLASPARAGFGNDILAGIAGAIVSAMGWILVKLMGILVYFAQYNGFIQSAAVTNGWVIVRDVCNMFFVLILLVIAFATILQIEEYNYKKWLPKLILMAVLINFSKMICGLLIDAAQIIMLTFVNSFKDVAGANLTSALGIKNWQNMNDAGGGDWQVTASLLLAVVYVVISVIVIAAMLAMIAMRIVMLWIYIVLSPAAYLFSAFPAGKKYASQWWTQFTQNLVVGPVLAFFIWLSFTSLATFSSGQFKENNADVASGVGAATACVGAACTYGASETLIQFIIAIGMLLGGMKITQEIGGVAGSAAGSVFEKGKGLAIKGAKGIGGLALLGAKTPLSYGVDKLHQKTGVDLNIQRAWGVMQAKRKEIKEKRYGEGVIAARTAMESGSSVHGILAMTGNPGDAFEQMSSLKGVGKRLKGGKRMQELRGEGLQEEKQAKTDKARYEFEEKWANTDPDSQNANGVNKRTEMVQDVETERDLIAEEIKNKRTKNSSIDKDLAEEKVKNPLLQDKVKVKNLEEEKEQNSARISDLRKRGEELQPIKQFIDNVQNKGEKGKVYTNDEKNNIKMAQNKAGIQATEAQKKVERNVPEYAFEARAIEQKLVSGESSKIKDITDPTELLRILKDAISGHDTTMVKAITLKMTRDYNDNEFTKPLVGDTSYLGVQDLMRQFATKGSKNYAGFNQQEAFSLGSQIAELNKATKHWAATAAYKMENGEWKETTDKEHNEIRSKESGKRQLEASIREDNRLAYGKHDADDEFHLDVGGILKLQSIDNDNGHKRMETMPESAAQYVYAAIMKNPKLIAEFGTRRDSLGKTLIDMFETRLGPLAGKVTKDTSDYSTRYGHANDLLRT